MNKEPGKVGEARTGIGRFHWVRKDYLKASRARPRKTIVVYCDESSQTKHRFFVLGAMLFSPVHSTAARKIVEWQERRFLSLREECGLATIKWEKVPPSQGTCFDSYKRILAELLRTSRVRFKCLVVDTHKYPLDHFKGGNLVGYQKFYCTLLADGLMKEFPDHFFDIRVDDCEGRPGCEWSDLERTAQRRFVRRNAPTKWRKYCSIVGLDDRQHVLLQLTDLVVGAVAFKWNHGMTRTSAGARRRQELVKMIETICNVDLSFPATAWENLLFNVWLLDPNPRM